MGDYAEHDAWVEKNYPSDQYIVVPDDDEVGPTEKYGVWLGVIVFCGIVILSCCVVAGIMYVSMAQERAKFISIQGASLK
jgi:hypothetical protein